MAKILLVEDDKLLASNIADFLHLQRHSIEVLYDGLAASEFLSVSGFDLLILDWELPSMSGIELCRFFRNKGSKAPILFLTARKSLGDKILGFDAGADDYLTKPFEMKELAVRITALLRRSSVDKTENILVLGDIELDLMKRQVRKNGELIPLQEREYQFLEFLLRHKGQSFTSEQLLRRVWASESVAGTAAVKTLVNRLRGKIDPDGRLLRTVHSYGYILSDED